MQLRYPVAVAALAVGILLVGPVLRPGRAEAATTALQVGSCTDGLRDATAIPARGAIRGLMSLDGGRVLGVGSRSTGERWASVNILTGFHGQDGWQFVESKGPGGIDAGLEAVTRTAAGGRWAVGIRYVSNSSLWPLVVRWASGQWQNATPRTPRGIGTAIAADPGSRIWVATVEWGTGLPASRIYGREGGRWTRATLPSVPGAERYASIVAPTANLTVAVGASVSARGVRPVIVVRDGSAWHRERVEPGGAQILLTHVFQRGEKDLQATGWSIADRIRPVILQRGEDRVWRPIELAGATGAAAVITDAVSASASTIAGGASYLSSAGQWLPALAFPGADPDWLVSGPRGWFVRAVTGDPTTDGWVSVSSTRKSGAPGSRLARMCDLVPVGDPGIRQRMRRQRREELAREAARARSLVGRDRRESTAARERRPRLPPSPVGVLSGSIRLVDIAPALGLPVRSSSYGLDSGDVDGDGRLDLVWSRHGGPLAVFLRTGSGFTAHIGSGYAPADRHGCVAAPLDDDAKADIACVTGGMNGLGITSNELYLDPTSDVTTDTGTERGLTDPIARGRKVVAFDAEGDGDQDLYVLNEERLDGLPNINRLLLNDGRANFSWAPASGLSSTFGYGSVDQGDFDGNGMVDLLVGHLAHSPSGQGIHLYQNQGDGTFRDVAGALGVRTIGEADVALAQLDGVGRQDIVQLSEGRLVIRLWRGDSYVVAVDRPVAQGHAVEAGDVDGDGDQDLYLQLGSYRQAVRDVILRNDGSGRHWTTVAVPGSLEGRPDDVLALDVDDDDRDEFIVVSGHQQSGPFRVIDAR